MLVPALLVVAFVAIYPLGRTVYQSFTDEEFLGGSSRCASWASRTTGT